jgi:hypothetical protein
MILLFLNELSSFSKVKTVSEMLVDTNRNSDKLKINIDVTMNRIPCQILSIDIQDIMGSHSFAIQGHLTKTKLDQAGRAYGVVVELAQNSKDKEPDYEEVKKAVQNSEGCRIQGDISVMRVPGNFHISSHAFSRILSQLAAEGLYKFDVSHKINHISFGDKKDLQEIKEEFNVGVVSPLDGTLINDHSEHKVIEYYIKVVPTTYVNLSGKSYHVHQFTSNQNTLTQQHQVPTVYFRYDISPILVKYTQTKQPLFHFFIQICAIVGGMFTVIGIVDNLVYKMFKKNKE